MHSVSTFVEKTREHLSQVQKVSRACPCLHMLAVDVPLQTLQISTREVAWKFDHASSVRPPGGVPHPLAGHVTTLRAEARKARTVPDKH